MPRLEIRTGRNTGKSYELTKSVILGRGDTADIQLPDAKASREHCRVFKQAGKWAVADLNSRNGINVNGLKATRKDLFEGDVIEVGETQVAFCGAEGPAVVQPIRQPGEIDVEELDLGADDEPAARPAAPAAPARQPTRPPLSETRASSPAARRPAAGGKKQSAKEAAFAAARAQAQSPRGRGGSSSSSSSGSPADGIQVSHKVLQFSKVDAKKAGFLSVDLSQYSTLVHVCIWGGVVALAAGGIYVFFNLMAEASR